MIKQYCKQYFYPEERCNLTPEQYIILDNLRIIKVQDAQIVMELVKQRQK